MCDRMSESARDALNRARDEALRRNHDHTGPEHVLLALIGPNPSILSSLGLTRDEVRAAVEAIAPPLPTPVDLPQSPRVKATIDRAVAEARRLGHDELGVEHLLLGMLAESDSPAAQALVNLGVTAQLLQPHAGPRVGEKPPAAPKTLPIEYAPLEEVLEQLAEATLTAAGAQEHERAVWLREMEAKLRMVRRRLAA